MPGVLANRTAFQDKANLNFCIAFSDGVLLVSEQCV